MLTNIKIYITLILVILSISSNAQKRLILDELYIGRDKVSGIAKDTIDPTDSLTLATTKAVGASEIWQYLSRDSLLITVKGGYATVVGGNIIPAGTFTVLDTAITRGNPGPVTIPDGSVLAFDPDITYDSLNQVSYAGNIWRLDTTTIPATIPVNKYPGAWNKWVQVTTDNPASIKSITLIDEDISEDSIQTLLASNKLSIRSTLTDTTTFDRTINIPHVDSISGQEISIENNDNSSVNYRIVSSSKMYLDGRSITEYYLDSNESVKLSKGDSGWGILRNKTNKDIVSTIGLFEEGEFEISNAYYVTEAIPDKTIDSLFIIPIKNKTSVGQNLIYGSENPEETATAVGTIWNPGTSFLFSDKLKSPYGSKVSLLTGSGSTRMFWYTPDSLNIGDTLTFSAEVIKAGNSSSNLVLNKPGFITGPAFTSVTITPSRTWRRQEVNIVLTEPYSANQTVQMLINNTDSVYFSRPQLELGSSATPYKDTRISGITTGSVITGTQRYAVYKPVDGRLYLNRLKGGIAVSDDELLSKAYDYCADGFCNEIVVSGIYNITKPILPQENITLFGSTELKGNVNTSIQQDKRELGATFVSQLGDTTATLFSFIRPSGDARVFQSAGLKNLSIILKDSLQKVFYVQEANGFSIENISITNENGFSAHVDTILHIDRISPSDSYWLNFEHIKVGSTVGNNVGIFVDNGGLSTWFKDIDISSSNNAGIIVNGTRFNGDGLIIQGCRRALDVKGFSRISVKGLYTEGSSTALRVEDGVVNISSSTLQGNGADSTIIQLGGNLNIDNTQIRSLSNLYVSNTIDHLSIVNSTSQIDLTSFIPYSIRDKVTIDKVDGSTNFTDSDKRMVNDFSENATSFNRYEGDSIFVGNSALLAKRQNLVSNSEVVFPAGTYYGTTDSIVVKEDNFLAPDGTTTATTFVYSGSDLGASVVGSSAFTNSSNDFEVGEYYTVSLWIYSHDKDRRNAGPLSYRLMSEVDNGFTPFYYLPADKWIRVYSTRKVESVGSTSWFSRLSGTSFPQSSGDSVSVWGLQVNKGKLPLSYTKTTTSFIDETTGPTYKIGSNGQDTVTYLGGLKTSTLINPYGGSNEIGANLDSIRFKSYKNISHILSNNSNIRIGDHIEDRSTKVQYNLQADSIPYFLVEDSLVIDLSSKYAVADLSQKREFNSRNELESQLPLLNLNSSKNKVKVAGEDIEISFSPSALTADVWDYQNQQIDGVFLKAVPVEYEGENTLQSSEYFVPAGSSYGTNFQMNYQLNNDISDDNQRNTALLTGITGSGDTNIFLYNESGTITTGVNYTISFDMKVVNASGTPTITVGGNSVNLNTDGETHRYNITFENNNATFTTMTFGGTSITDTFQFSRPQVEIGDVTTFYKGTVGGISATRDSVYVEYGASILENGTLRLDKYGIAVQNDLRYFGNDTTLLKLARDFCNEGVICNEIVLPKGNTYLHNFDFTNNLIIRGAEPLKRGQDDVPIGHRGGSRIIVAPTDSTTNGFNLVPYDGNNKIWNSGFKDVELVVRDTLDKLIYVKECQGCVFDFVAFIEPEDNGKINTGIEFDVEESSDQTRNSGNIYIKGDTTTVGLAVKYAGSVFNDLSIYVNRVDTALLQTGGLLNVERRLSTQNCNNGIILEGGELYVEGGYTEGAGQNGGVVFKQTGGSAFFNNFTFQSEAATDSLLYISAGQLTINGGKIRTFGKVQIEDSDDIVGIKLHGIGSTYPLAKMSFPNRIMDNVKVTGNYNWTTKKPYPDYIPYQKVDNSLIKNSVIKDTKLANRLTTSNTSLVGESINLLETSNEFENQLGSFITGSGTDTIKVFINALETDPIDDGVTGNVTTVAYTGPDYGGGSMGWFAFDIDNTTTPFEIGDYYTLGIWVRSHQIADRPSFPIQTRMLGSTDNQETFYIKVDTNWTFQTLTGRINNATGSDVLTIRFDQALLNADSISFYNAVLVPGKHEAGDILTSGTAIYNTSTTATIEIPNGLDLQGSVTNVDSLEWKMYTVTTASTVTLNYPNNIVSSTLNNGTFILDPSGFTGENMIVKVNSFADDDVTLDASGSYNFTINGTTQATYDLIGDGAYAEFTFNSSLGTFELQNSSNDHLRTLTGITTSTTHNVTLNNLISIDSDNVASETAVSLDASALPVGAEFEINIRDAEVYNCVIDANGNSLNFNGRQLSGDSLRFVGSSTYVLDCTHTGSGNITCYNKTDYTTNTGEQFLYDTTYTYQGATTDSLFIPAGDTVNLQLQDWVNVMIESPLNNSNGWVTDSTIIVDEDGASYAIRLTFAARTPTPSTYMEVLFQAPGLSGEPFIIRRTFTFPKGTNTWVVQNAYVGTFGGSITGEPLLIRITSPSNISIADADINFKKLKAAHGIRTTYAP